MICTFCKRDNAEFHSTTIKNNEIITLHICRSCKQDMNIQDKTEELDNSFDHLLDALIQPRDSFSPSDSGLTCKTCGTTLKDLKQTSFVGCGGCYKVFAHAITGDRSPGQERDRRQSGKGSAIKTLALLRKDLREAVRLENFEKAAEIRDRIRYFEEGFI